MSGAVATATTLTQAFGEWCVPDSSLYGNFWAIEEGGRAFFDGKRLGTEYGLLESTAYDPGLWSRAVEQAVAMVQGKDYIPPSLTNQVVADELLRAKLQRGGGSCRPPPGLSLERGAARAAPAVPVESVRNPGSAGHPYLCLRPCLYFARGACANGDGCGFCHLPHPKQPVRLGKFHRESLKKMPFGQFVHIVLPVLQQKARDLDFGPDVRALVDGLWSALAGLAKCEDCSASMRHVKLDSPSGRLSDSVASTVGSGMGASASAAGCDNRSSSHGSDFGGALKAMSFRSLLLMLLSKAPEEQMEVRLRAEKVLQVLGTSAARSALQTSPSERGLASSRAAPGPRNARGGGEGRGAARDATAQQRGSRWPSWAGS